MCEVIRIKMALNDAKTMTCNSIYESNSLELILKSVSHARHFGFLAGVE